MTLQDALKVNGKAKFHTWPEGSWIKFVGHEFVDHDGLPYCLNPCQYMCEMWEPYKEPCKHEPFKTFYIPRPQLFDLVEFSLPDFECKHCGVKIKAVGWEVV